MIFPSSPRMSLKKSKHGTMLDWFKAGMDAVLLAPTAVNQQKFLFTLGDGKVSAMPGHAFYVKRDLGIAKYHSEVGAGKENVQRDDI